MLAFALRVPFCVSAPQDPDGARFARALLRYDLTQGHPHPPGYPLFIALGSAIHAVGPSPGWSLSLVSALSGAALVAVFTSWCIRRFGTAAAVLGAALLALVPLTTTLSARPLSDMLGAALAWSALVSALRAPLDARRTAILSALVLLVRASTFALCAPALAVALYRDRRHRIAAMALAVAVAVGGYLPVVLITGPYRFVGLVFHHGVGHFQRFGGSVVTHPDLGARIRAFGWTLWTHALGGAWSDRPRHLLASSAVVAAACALGLWTILRHPDRGGARLVLTSTLVYATWAFLGQNILWSPRHLLPLVPSLAWLFATGASTLLRRWPRAALTALLLSLLPLAIESIRLAKVQRDQPPPAAAVAAWLSRHTDPTHTVVATAQLGPWIRGLTPAARVVDVEDASDLRRLHLAPSDRLFVTSEVHGADTLRGIVRAGFSRSRYVNPALYDLALIEVAR